MPSSVIKNELEQPVAEDPVVEKPAVVQPAAVRPAAAQPEGAVPPSAGRFVLKPESVTPEIAAGGFQVLSQQLRDSMVNERFVEAAQTRQKLRELMATPGGVQYTEMVNRMKYSGNEYLDGGTKAKLMTMTMSGLESELASSGFPMSMLDNRQNKAYWLGRGAAPDDAETFAAITNVGIEKDPDSVWFHDATEKRRLFEKYPQDPGKAYGEIRQYENNISQYRRSFYMADENGNAAETAASRTYATRAYNIVEASGLDAKTATNMVTWARRNSNRQGDPDNALAPSEFAMSMLEQVAAASQAAPDVSEAWKLLSEADGEINLSGGSRGFAAKLGAAAPKLAGINKLGVDPATKTLLIKALGMNQGLYTKTADYKDIERAAIAKLSARQLGAVIGSAVRDGSKAEAAAIVQSSDGDALVGVINENLASPEGRAVTPVEAKALAREYSVQAKRLQNIGVDPAMATYGQIFDKRRPPAERIAAVQKYLEMTKEVGTRRVTGPEAQALSDLATAIKDDNDWTKRVPGTITDPGAVDWPTATKILSDRVERNAATLANEVGTQLSELLRQKKAFGWNFEELVSHAKDIPISDGTHLIDFLNTPTGRGMLKKIDSVKPDSIGRIMNASPVGKVIHKGVSKLGEGITDLWGGGLYLVTSAVLDDEQFAKVWDPSGVGKQLTTEMLNSGRLTFNADGKLSYDAKKTAITPKTVAYGGKEFNVSTEEGQLQMLDFYTDQIKSTATGNSFDTLVSAGEEMAKLDVLAKQLQSLDPVVFEETAPAAGVDPMTQLYETTAALEVMGAPTAPAMQRRIDWLEKQAAWAQQNKFQAQGAVNAAELVKLRAEVTAPAKAAAMSNANAKFILKWYADAMENNTQGPTAEQVADANLVLGIPMKK